MKKLATLLLLVACACRPSTPLTLEKAKGMIEASFAFQAPLDDDLKSADPRLAAPMKRQILTVENIAVKPDDAFSMAGETASVIFTWRFDQGPLAGSRYSTVAKIHGDSHDGWKLYEEKLAHSLRVSVVGE